MANQDYYADAAPPAAATPPTADDDPKDKDPSDSQTTIIPKALLGGHDYKVGDECTFKIVQMNEDGAVVSPADSGENEEEAPPEQPTPEQAQPQGGGSPMASLME